MGTKRRRAQKPTRKRAQDPLAILPTDVGLCVLAFLTYWQVARMRCASREWCKLGNIHLSRIRSLTMPDVADTQHRKSAVQFVSSRCSSLQSLSADMYDVNGYSARDIKDLLSACGRVTTLSLDFTDHFYTGSESEAEDQEQSSESESESESDNESAPVDADDDMNQRRYPVLFAPIRSTVQAGAFRSLISLSVGVMVSDADAHVLAEQLPCLRALCFHYPDPICAYDEDDTEDEDLLTSDGVCALINGISSLIVLHLSCPVRIVDPFPVCRSGIRRLSLQLAYVYENAFVTMLRHIGSDLRTLDLLCVQLKDIPFFHEDVILQHVADGCPNLECLSLVETMFTRACLPSLARMACLRDLLLDYPYRFSDADLDWLRQNTLSRVLVDYREVKARYPKEASDYMADRFCSFAAMAAAEGVPHLEGNTKSHVVHI